MTPYRAFRFRLDMLRSSLDVIELALSGEDEDAAGARGFARTELPLAVADAREAVAELEILVELLAPARPATAATGPDARGALAALRAGLSRKG